MYSEIFIDQNYSKYTETDHEVWAELCSRRIPQLQEQSCRAFLNGLDVIKLDTKRVPNLADINANLSPVTGWTAAAVGGYIPAKQFFWCLSQRKFPTTTSVRTWEQLEYLPEPDIFHDVFGHVPTQADQVFGDFMADFGALAMTLDDERLIEQMARLYWFTVEFGLIREGGKLKLYGSGLMSSLGEGAYALSDATEKKEFDLETVINTSFEIDHYQPLLFVIDSFDQLYESVREYADLLKRQVV